MGIALDNPIIVGASNLSNDLDTIKKAEDEGAAAIVYKSLFEEQIQLERFQIDEKLNEYNDMYAEMLTQHPAMRNWGPEEHLLNLSNAKESLSIPLIASLNAVNIESWIKYAKLISETGVDGLELNFYQIPSDFTRTANEIEDEQLNIVKEIKKVVTIPVSVKLSTDYSNLLNFISKLDEAGVNAFVLFNSFFQPDIDINSEKHIKTFKLSNNGDYKNSLRFAGILYENIKADVCGSRGVYSGQDVIKLLLSGASCVQVVSTLYKNGFSQIAHIKKELVEWMNGKNYNSIADFKGKLSKDRVVGNPFIYKRAQYIDLLLNSETIFGEKH